MILSSGPVLGFETAAEQTVRPLPKSAPPAQAIRDAFIQGARQVILTAVRLEERELRRGLEQLRVGDFVGWADPLPLGPSRSRYRLRERAATPPHLGALGIKKHAWDAVGNGGWALEPRTLMVELAVRALHLGLSLETMPSEAAPFWSLRDGASLLRGWALGLRRYDP